MGRTSWQRAEWQLPSVTQLLQAALYDQHKGGAGGNLLSEAVKRPCTPVTLSRSAVRAVTRAFAPCDRRRYEAMQRRAVVRLQQARTQRQVRTALT